MKALSFILFLSFFVQSVVGVVSLQVKCPSDGANIKEQSCIMIILKDEYTMMGGHSDEINIDIIYPDGTYLCENAHPYQVASGIYRYNFVTRVYGEHVVIADITYYGILIQATGQFTAKYNEYFNVSRIYERVGDFIYLENLEEDRMTERVVEMIKLNQPTVDSIKNILVNKNERQDLGDVAINSFYKSIFSLLTLFIVSFLLGLITIKKRCFMEKSIKNNNK